MKKNKLNIQLSALLIAVAALFTMASCEKFLDVDPKSKITDNNFFQSVDQAEIFARGVFTVLADDDLYGQRLSMIYPLDTDEGRYSTSSVTDNSSVGLAHYNMTPSNTMLESTFNKLYFGVSRANEAIARIRSMSQFSDGTATEKQQLRHLLGEMITLRSLFYFDLIKNWGDVPFVAEPTDYNLPAAYYQKPRTSRDFIYDYLVDDLLNVVDTLNIPWRSSSNTPERINQGSARGLLARLCLHAAGYALRWDLDAQSPTANLAKRNDPARIRELYEVAHEQCRIIMQSGEHKLNPSFENVFRTTMELKPDKTYGESMFEIAFAFANNAGGGRVGAFNSSRQDANCRWGKGNGYVISIPNLYISYEVTLPDLTTPVSYLDPRSDRLLDKRRDVTICNYVITDTNTFEMAHMMDYSAGKWRRYWMPENASSNADRTCVNWGMLRYSDILLMYAEAEFYLHGNTAEAREAINKVRRRGYGYDPNTPVLTGNVDLKSLTNEPNTDPQDGICKEIVQERTLELAHEGLRKYDLIRWGIMDEKLKAARENLNILTTRIDPFGRQMFSASTFTVVPGLWPAELNFYKLGQDPSLLDPKEGRDNTSVRGSKYFAGSFGDDKIRLIGRDFKKHKSELYPISQTVLDANPQLTQCPGYH